MERKDKIDSQLDDRRIIWRDEIDARPDDEKVEQRIDIDFRNGMK